MISEISSTIPIQVLEESSFQKSLYELISSETKEMVMSIFLNNFDIITTCANNILTYNKQNKLTSNTENIKTPPASITYLYYLDILLIVFLNKNTQFLSILTNNSSSIFNCLINNLLCYTNNTFLQIKILKILEITLDQECYKDYIKLVVENESIGKFIETGIEVDTIIDYDK